MWSAEKTFDTTKTEQYEDKVEIMQGKEFSITKSQFKKKENTELFQWKKPPLGHYRGRRDIARN